MDRDGLASTLLGLLIAVVFAYATRHRSKGQVASGLLRIFFIVGGAAVLFAIARWALRS